MASGWSGSARAARGASVGVIFMLFTSVLPAQARSGPAPEPPTASTLHPVVRQINKVATSKPLKDLRVAATKSPLKKGATARAVAKLSLAGAKTGGHGKNSGTARVQTKAPVRGGMPAFDLDFEGIDQDCGCLPPDTEGDVSPDNYIQWVNLSMQIFDKQGTALTGLLPGNWMWQGIDSQCATTNDGDPIVMYDQLADRWFLSQFAFPNFPNPPFTQCVAISVTNDPLGSYYLYQYDTPSNKLNDYPKFGVWPDAYYQTINQFSAGSLQWAGAGVFALERDKMLQGLSAQLLYVDLFGVETWFGGMLPADLEGLFPPAQGTPGLFAEVDDSAFSPVPQDQMELWQFHVDWTNPANSTFGVNGEPNQNLPTDPFDIDMCSFNRSCIPQPGTSQGLDAISDRLMYRLQAHVVGNQIDLVTNHTVDVDGTDHAGVRWYDVRTTTGVNNFAIQNQGTYAPDGDNRWMGSAAMDASGDIAVGYSVSSSTVSPSIRVAGRLVSDPAGQLSQGETEMIAGSGAQLHPLGRWGDYSALVLDPLDGCTYWYTQEYTASVSSADWHTRIGHFKFPSCTLGPTGTLQGTVTSSAPPNNPIANALVSANGITTHTNASGDYTLTLPVDTYTVTASAYGFAAKTVNNVAVTDGGTTVEDFALDPLPTAVVSGTVTDGSGHGWPLYAKITIDGYPFGPVFTDPVTGQYSVTLVQSTPFTFHVNAVAAGYVPQVRPVEVPPDSTTQDFSLLVDATTCVAPGYHFNEGTPVLSEGFGGSDQIPPGWTVVDNIVPPEGHVWRINDPEGQPNLTGGDGNFADINSDFYGPADTQDTELITPVLDLSGVPSPIIKFNSDYFGYPGQTGDIDVTTDGGTTWTNVWHHGAESVRGPDLETAVLSGAGGHNAAQVRFHFIANFGFWWEVDNVDVLNRTCDPIPGGMVVGNVTDLTTGNALNGAKVTSDDQTADNALSAATPADPNNPDGFYSLFSSLTGSHPFTASKANYSNDTETVNVPVDGVIRQDFALGSGHLTVNPTSLEVTVAMGSTTDAGLTIHNDGSAPADFELTERDRGSTILFAKGARTFRQNGTFSPYRARPQSGGGGDEEPPRPPNAPPWTNIADYPSAIMDNTADAFGGKVYSVGGFNGGATVNNGYVYDPGANAWSPIAGMADAREKPAAAFANGLLYVVGGWDTNGNPDPKLEIYDPGADSWTTGADIPAARAAASAVTLNGKIYVIGGCPTGSSCGATDVFVYEPGTNAWASASAYPEMTSWTHCGAIGGLIYCGGGTAGNSESKHAYAYDPGADSWTAIADLPETRWAGGSAAANGMLLISGGVTNNFSTITNEGFAYDPGSDTWSPIANSNFLLYRGASACGFYRVGGSTGGFSPVADSELLPGLDVCGVPADVKWLSEDPSSGTIDPTNSQPVTVHFDASVPEVPQPGDYMADIGVKENTPYTVPPIPVTMHVTPPATWGKLQGTVVGLGLCDVPGNPLAKAAVHVDGTTNDFDLQTDNNGYFAWWMDAGNSPLSITVHKAGWVDQTHPGVIILPQQTTTENFTLRLAASCLHATPTSITKTQLLGTTTTATLQITNTGALDANVKLGERKGSFTILKADGAPLRTINGAKGTFTPAFLGNKKGTIAGGINAGAPLAPTWSTIASYPTGIMDNGADFIDGKLYSVGGLDSGFNILANGFVYDPNTDAWSPIADMPAPREKPGVAAVDGKLYVSGGWDTSGNPIAETDVYDPGSNSWSAVSANPHPAAAPGVAVDGSTIYFVGGCQDGGCTTSTNVVAYDTGSDAWSTRSGYPHNNAWEGCGGINGQVICAGGTDGGATFSDGFAYNPGSDSWSPIAGMPLDLWASAAGAPNGLLVLSSGVTNGFSTVTNQGVAYDPATDSWSSIPNAQFPVYRAGGSCGFFKVGGSSAGFSPGSDSERLSELDQCGVSDVLWLSENPATFTVPADTGVQNVTVTLAATLANGVDQPGTYTAGIIVQHNTVDSIAPVNVTLNVTPPRTWGKLAGTVLGKNCQGQTAPLRGVQIQVSGQFGFSKDLTTDGAGKYAWWLDAKYSLLKLIASKDGYAAQTKSKVAIKKGKVTTVNFTLQKLGC